MNECSTGLSWPDAVVLLGGIAAILITMWMFFRSVR